MNRDGVYGNLSADPRLENLWHVASCSSGQSFAMDFEFQGGGRTERWDDDGHAGSIVQVHIRVRIEGVRKSPRHRELLMPDRSILSLFRMLGGHQGLYETPSVSSGLKRVSLVVGIGLATVEMRVMLGMDGAVLPRKGT